MDVRIKHGDQNNGPMFHVTAENIPDRAGQTSRKPLHVILVTSTGDVYTAGGGGGSGGDGAINDGSNSTIKASVLQGPTARPGSNSNPLVVQFADDPTRQIGQTSPPVTGVQIVGGWSGSVSPSGDFPVRIASTSVPVGISGDVSTIPKAGQTWPVSIASSVPVSFSGQIGVQIIGGSIGAQVQPSGDFPVRISAATVGLGITGDVSTTPKAGQTWPVVHQGAIGVQIVGGSAASQVSPSGDFPVRIAAATAGLGITGDVSTTPKAGQSWPVKEQNVIGVQVMNQGGSVSPSGDFPIRIATQSVGLGITGDVSTKPAAGQFWPVKEQNIIGVQVVNPGGRVSISGDQLAVVQQGAWAVAGTGDFSTTPKVGQTWPVREQGVVGVQVVGGGTNRVSISGDQLNVNQQGAWAVAGTGDFSTTPKAGQIWPVSHQGPIGVQIVGGSAASQVQPSGDFPIRIAAATAPLGITGDVSTVPKAGQFWPVKEQNTLGVQINGGSVGAQVSPSGDFPIRIGAATAPLGITGDVSTLPKAGQTWPTSQQGIIGVQVVGGQVGGSHGVSGDVTIKPGTIPAGQYFPVSGDTTLADGLNRGIKATVKQYTDSNPVAVVLMNPSGDAYIPTPKEPINVTIPFNITAAGTTTLAGPYNGRVIKVISYDLQGSSDIATAQGHFGSAASGSQLSPDWLFAVREGVSKQVPGVGGSYIFKTILNQALVFELSAGAMRGSVTFQTGDSF